MPQHRRIHSQNRSIEPTLGLVGETRDDEVGPHLHDRLAARLG
jgi:hypothetical protein